MATFRRIAAGSMRMGCVFLLSATLASCNTASAAETQPLLGSWCVTYHSGTAVTVLVLSIGTDGNLTAINANQGLPPAGPGTDVYTRSAGLGTVTRLGSDEFEARYQYFDYKNGSFYRRFLVTLPMVYDPASDTLSNDSKDITIRFVNTNNEDVTPASLPPQSYTASRVDLGSNFLCDLSLTP